MDRTQLLDPMVLHMHAVGGQGVEQQDDLRFDLRAERHGPQEEQLLQLELVRQLVLHVSQRLPHVVVQLSDRTEQRLHQPQPVDVIIHSVALEPLRHLVRVHHEEALLVRLQRAAAAMPQVGGDHLLPLSAHLADEVAGVQVAETVVGGEERLDLLNKLLEPVPKHTGLRPPSDLAGDGVEESMEQLQQGAPQGDAESHVLLVADVLDHRLLQHFQRPPLEQRASPALKQGLRHCREVCVHLGCRPEQVDQHLILGARKFLLVPHLQLHHLVENRVHEDVVKEILHVLPYPLSVVRPAVQEGAGEDARVHKGQGMVAD
eukprot:752812-Hanusia_phi.AAC.5